MTIKIKTLFTSIIAIACFSNNNSFSSEIPTIPDDLFVVPEKRDFQLNKSISPCNNFFDYVCTNEIKDFKLPESKNRYVFSFNDASERIKKQRFDYINSLLNDSNLSSQNAMIKNYYSSCMNEKSRKSEELLLIDEYKKEILNLSKEKLLEKFALESLTGNSNLISINEFNNRNNPKIKDILFYYNLRFGSKDYYFDDNLMKDYQDNMKQFFNLISMPELKNNTSFIINYEKSIAKVYPSKAEFRTIFTSDNSIKKEKLLSEYPNLYFKTMLSKIPKNINLNLVTNDVVKQINLSFQKASLKELQALAIWNRFSMQDIKYSYPDLYKKDKDFHNKYFGSSKIEESLELQCTVDTGLILERNLDIEVLNKYYKNFPEQRVKSIVHQIQKTTLENVEKNTWLSKEAKLKAELKIKKIRFQLVKPDNIEDWDLIDITELKPDTFIKNKRKIANNEFNKMLKEIELPVNDLKWQMSPLTVNAYYNPTANQFVMPLGILQAPFFDETKSDIINFGSVGMVVAHEIGHSIDDQGSKYDELGKLNPWMNKEDLKIFNKKTFKIINLFTKDGVDGKLTLGENIADFVGVKNAFQSAFPNKKSENIEEQKEFFIQFAKVWCGVLQPKVREYFIKNDPHSPIDLRVNNQMKLTEKFEETFSCKKGDPMTLPNEERITLW
ncbi:M13 family metallopeptidase [Silvanigrella sp.]|jgi:putative endopeptidase|uniref:M13 family metallopeptidase n=1 Tax=Silvanigrella sp. TaxID=2024976 RepID=UPI0037C81365